ncbi:hypothetical protein MTO96_025554 [Rhipicephalus appendiculatus]
MWVQLRISNKPPEIGLDTQREMKAWDPQEKKAFRTGAQAFYTATAKHLVKQLPLDNKLLLHLRFLDPSSHLTTEERVVIEVVELKPGCGVFVEKKYIVQHGPLLQKRDKCGSGTAA